MRWLGRVGLDPADLARAKGNAFCQLLVSIVAVERWDAVARAVGGPDESIQTVTAVAATVGALLAWSRRTRTVGLLLLLFVIATSIARDFPATANHHYFEAICLLLLLLLRTDVASEARQLTASLRFMLLCALFYSGLQKLAFGYYFGGEFLAFAVARASRFATVLAPLLPSAELARLTAIPMGEGAGPFRVAAPAFVLASNAAWLAELALPAMLLVPWLRKPGVVLVCLYFAAIEAAAREVFFGGIMVALALLFWPGNALGRARVVYGLALVYLLSMIFGVLPRWEFT